MRRVFFAPLLVPALAVGAPPSNVRVNDPAADTTVEDTQSTSAIVRVSGTTLLAAFDDSGSYATAGDKFTGWARSTDNGATWADRGTLPSATLGDVGDPRLARSASTGTIFLSTLSYHFSGAVTFLRSTDGGVTFSAPTNAAPGAGIVSLPGLAVDNFAGASQGVIYLGYRDADVGGGMKMTRSTDDGVTWGPSGGTGLTSNSGQGAALVVAPDHTLDYYYFLQGIPLQGTPSTIRIQRSTDGGATFSASAVVASLVTTGTNGDLGFPYRTNAFPRAVVDPASGNRYLVYDDRSGTNLDAGNIYLRSSTDGGSTWSSPVTLNDDETTNAQFHPSIAITPDGRHLFVAWYDRRSDPMNIALEYWGVIGTIGGGAITFGRNFKIGSAGFQPVYGVDPAVVSTYMTDYESVVADNAGFDVLWGDGRDPSTAAMRNNMNVRFSRIPTPLRGDVNGDFVVDLRDVFHLINLLFASGPPAASPCQADANSTGGLDVTDAFFLINYLFASGPAPAGGC